MFLFFQHHPCGHKNPKLPVTEKKCHVRYTHTALAVEWGGFVIAALLACCVSLGTGFRGLTFISFYL